MKRKFLILILLLALLEISSCISTTNLSRIPEPKLKTTLNVEISIITNISTNYILNTSYLLNSITKSIENFNFSEYLEDNTTNESIETIQTNSQNFEIDMDKIIKSTLEKRFKRFIKQLRTFSPSVDQIVILNTANIEEELIKQKTSLRKETNYITNTIFETNYYISKDDTNKVEVEVIQKERVISEVKIKQEDFRSLILKEYPWVLDITNGIKFLEGKPADFSISALYNIDDKFNKLDLIVIVSNNNTSNFTVMKTNMTITEFLTSDEKMFSNLKHFFYQYQSALLLLEIHPEEYEVFVDDVYLGKGKKFSEILSYGIHKITFSKDTYKLDEYIFLEKGKVNLYIKNFKDRQYEFSKLYLDSIPSGADVFIENEYIGKTPTNIIIPKGKYRVWITKGELESFNTVELTEENTNITFPLKNLKDKTSYNILSGFTVLLGTATISSIFLYFWADSQERHYDFLYQKERKQEYYQMKEYYYYFKDNMRTVSITGAIGTFILWGITLGVESDKFSIQITTRF